MKGYFVPIYYVRTKNIEYSYLRNQILLFEPFHYENHMFYILKHIDFEVHHQELCQLTGQI